MITSARQGRKEETEKSLWNFFFFPYWDVFLEEEAGWGLAAGGAGRAGGGCGGPDAPGCLGARLVNHCRPLSPALSAHWKTLVNQQMMPSNFPISCAPKGCSFLQLVEKRPQPLRKDFAPRGWKVTPSPTPPR